jgi:hypothetical protein
MLVLQLSGCVTFDERSGPYQGTIVDADTNLPIQGAAVLAVWYRAIFSLVGHPTERFHDAREVVSDSDGRFFIPRLTGSVLKLSVQPPTLYFFAPGYWRAPYRVDHRRASPVGEPPLKTEPTEGRALIDTTIVPMRRIVTREEWCRYQLIYMPSRSSVPGARMRLFESLVLREQRSRGACISLTR